MAPYLLLGWVTCYSRLTARLDVDTDYKPHTYRILQLGVRAGLSASR